MATSPPIIQQRPLRGSRISSFYPVKSLPSLSSLDSAFQLQEYISLLIRLDVHDVEKIVNVPGGSGANAGGAEAIPASGEGAPNGGDEKDGEGKGDITVDEACWIYEQLRRLAQDLSHPLITMLQQECNRSTCPEMKAGEWLYLCVAHGNDGAMEQCCAIDYILHTLDSATALLNSPRAFPSRLQIPQTSHRHFSSLARRLGRIFAHAYFHHREAFEQAEAESSLYARFLALTSKFELVPAEFLVIPPRVGGHAHGSEGEEGGDRDRVEPPRLLAAGLNPVSINPNNPTSAVPMNHVQTVQPFQAGEDDDSQGQGRAGMYHVQQPPPFVFGGSGSDGSKQPPPGLQNTAEEGSSGGKRIGRNRTDTMVFNDSSSSSPGSSLSPSSLPQDPPTQVPASLNFDFFSDDRGTVRGSRFGTGSSEAANETGEEVQEPQDDDEEDSDVPPTATPLSSGVGGAAAAAVAKGVSVISSAISEKDEKDSADEVTEEERKADEERKQKEDEGHEEESVAPASAPVTEKKEQEDDAPPAPEGKEVEGEKEETIQSHDVKASDNEIEVVPVAPADVEEEKAEAKTEAEPETQPEAAPEESQDVPPVEAEVKDSSAAEDASAKIDEPTDPTVADSDAKGEANGNDASQESDPVSDAPAGDTPNEATAGSEEDITAANTEESV